MKTSLVDRLAGFCVFSTLTIAAFRLKIICWQLGSPAIAGHSAMPVMLVIAVLAIISSIGSWREKPWGYFLAILLCAGENVMAVKGFYSQPANFRFGDIFGLALSGVPLAGGTIAAFLLLFAHYGKKPGRAPEPTSGTAPRHG